MTRLGAPLPPTAGWYWHPLRREELPLAQLLVVAVEGRRTATWPAEARGWLAATGRRGGIVGVRCASGTILGLFFYRVASGPGGPHTVVGRVRLIEPLGPHRTLAALLRAARELAVIHACRAVDIPRSDADASPSTEGMAAVGTWLGFAREGEGWRCQLDAGGTIPSLHQDRSHGGH